MWLLAYHWPRVGNWSVAEGRSASGTSLPTLVMEVASSVRDATICCAQPVSCREELASTPAAQSRDLDGPGRMARTHGSYDRTPAMRMALCVDAVVSAVHACSGPPQCGRPRRGKSKEAFPPAGRQSSSIDDRPLPVVFLPWSGQEPL